MTITPFNAGHSLGGTIWKIRSPSVGTIVYAVNMNHMRERHLDGTILMSGAGGTIFESLARPDLLITDAERANVIGSRRKDRDAALIGIQTLLGVASLLIRRRPRHNNHNPLLAFLSSPTLRRKHARPRVACIARSTLVFRAFKVSNMPSIAHRPRDAHLRAEYDGMARWYCEQRGCR